MVSDLFVSHFLQGCDYGEESQLAIWHGHDLLYLFSLHSEREDFCHAISRDGRSYSSTLFPSACRVLRRIGEEDLQDKMILISDKIKV